MHGGLQFQNKCPCDTVQGIPDYQKFRPFQWSQPQTHCMVVTRVYHSPQHLCSAQHSMLHPAFYAPLSILCSTLHSMLHLAFYVILEADYKYNGARTTALCQTLIFLAGQHTFCSWPMGFLNWSDYFVKCCIFQWISRTLCTNALTRNTKKPSFQRSCWSIFYDLSIKKPTGTLVNKLLDILDWTQTRASSLAVPLVHPFMKSADDVHPTPKRQTNTEKHN